MVIGPVQLAARDGLLEPPEERLVARVHAQRDLGALAVAAEVRVAHEHAEHEAGLEGAMRRQLGHVFHRSEKRETRAA